MLRRDLHESGSWVLGSVELVAGGLPVTAAEPSPSWPLQRVKGQSSGAALLKLSGARDQTLFLFVVSNPL